MMRRLIVAMSAALAFTLLTPDTALAQPACENHVTGNGYDALNNDVWQTNDRYEVGWTNSSSQCVEFVQNSLNYYIYLVCEARSSVVTLDYQGDVYFQGNYVDTVYPVTDQCSYFGFNVYTVVAADDPLLPDESVYSPNGYHRLIYQLDGNLVLYSWNSAVWASNTFDTPGQALVQQDGNFVIYDDNDDPVWATNTFSSGVFLAVRNDGQLVLYDRYGTVLWAYLNN